MREIKNCVDCDYYYSNERMGDKHICLNGASEHFGTYVDWIGLAYDDKKCVVVNGKTREEIEGDA